MDCVIMKSLLFYSHFFLTNVTAFSDYFNAKPPDDYEDEADVELTVLPLWFTKLTSDAESGSRKERHQSINAIRFPFLDSPNLRPIYQRRYDFI